MNRRRAFTLIELLVVIGIILVLMSIAVVGFRHVQYTGATRETIADLQICRDLLQEYQNTAELQNIEGPGPAQSTNMQPPAPTQLPIFVDPGTGPEKKAALNSNGTDLGSANSTDMGDKANPQGARYTAPAIVKTRAVMYLLLRDPKNRALIANVPPKRLMEGMQPNGQAAPNDASATMLLDGWSNPIIFVPAGGLHIKGKKAGTDVDFVVRSTGVYLAQRLPPVSPSDRPFFASAGQDGDFTTGDDNVYSFNQ